MHFDAFGIILWYFDIFCVCSIIFIISFEHLWTVFFAFFCNFMQLLFFGQDKWEQSINKISTEICFNEGFYVSMLSDVFLCSGGRGVCWDWGTWRSSSLPAFLFSSMDETVTWNEWLKVIKRGRKLAQNETLWNNMKHNESPKINQNQTPTKKYKINIKESKRYKKKWKRYIDLSARSFSSFRKPYWRSFLVEVSAYFKHLGASQACSWM